MPVKSDVLAFLSCLPRQTALPWEMEVAELRRIARERSIAASGVPEHVPVVRDIQVGGVPARLYAPTEAEHAVLIYLHGGGWYAGDLDSYDAFTRALSNAARCAVLSIDYRLAPEHPFPAGLEDCWAATTWASQRFASVAVGGDSSGGNLAAVVALRARDRGLRLALQLLIYPVLDYTAVNGPFYREFAANYDDALGGPEAGDTYCRRIHWIWEQYIPDPQRRLEADASPGQAESLEGVAPALVITAEHDILRGECEAYAARLKHSSVPAELVEYKGQVHGFVPLLGVMEDSRDVIERTALALQRAASSPTRKGRAHERDASAQRVAS